MFNDKKKFWPELDKKLYNVHTPFLVRVIFEDETTREIRTIGEANFLLEAAYKDIENHYGVRLKEECERNNKDTLFRIFVYK